MFIGGIFPSAANFLDIAHNCTNLLILLVHDNYNQVFLMVWKLHKIYFTINDVNRYVFMWVCRHIYRCTYNSFLKNADFKIFKFSWKVYPFNFFNGFWVKLFFVFQMNIGICSFQLFSSFLFYINVKAFVKSINSLISDFVFHLLRAYGIFCFIFQCQKLKM